MFSGAYGGDGAFFGGDDAPMVEMTLFPGGNNTFPDRQQHFGWLRYDLEGI